MRGTMSISQLNLEGKNRPEVAIERLQDNEPPGGYQLAFSGGKDSVVIYDLVVKSKVKFTPYMNWTGIDPPELYRFVKITYPQIEIRKPLKTMWRLIEEKQLLPRRDIRFCCEYLKEHGNTGFIITGVRWTESIARRKRRMVEISYRDKNVNFIHPIIDWTNYEVWEYIRAHGLPYCELYDKGFKRIGCLMCPMASVAETKRQIELYPKYVQAYIRACDRLIANGHDGHGKWKTGEEMFNWWVSKERFEKADSRLSFFG